MEYRNTLTGRVIERAAADEWLEASAGWTREDEPASHDEPEAIAEDNDEKEND